MKKLLCVFVAIIMVISTFGLTVIADEGVKVAVNGNTVSFDQPPVIRGGRTLVPARAVFEAIGASVYWDATENGGYVSVVSADKSVVLEVNRSSAVDYMVIDNVQKVVLDVPATIVGGRTLVPLRAIGDALSCEVGWDAETRTASLEYEVAEESLLSEEAVAANSALTFKSAAEEIKKLSAETEVNPMPLYENGVKYYQGIAVKEQKKYKKSATSEAKAEEYPVFATVDGDVVSGDLLEYFYAMYTDAQGNISEENIENATNDVMSLAVASVYAKNKGVKVDKNLIEITNIYLSSVTYGLDLDTFASLSGISKETVYDVCEKQAFRNALYIAANESGDIDISESKLKEKFESLFYKAKHILIKTVDEEMNPVKDSEKKQAKKTIDGILSKLKKGEDFDTLMKANSQDAESSFEGYVFTDGQMVEAFENGVKALKADEISPVIETEYGYHIIKRLVLSANDEAETFEYYKNALTNIIASEYFETKVVEWADAMEIVIF